MDSIRSDPDVRPEKPSERPVHADKSLQQPDHPEAETPKRVEGTVSDPDADPVKR